MSTQEAASIGFSIASDFTSFQLFELPEEIVQLLADHDPAQPILELKSDSTSGNAVLCTSNKTFPIRSVQTSNSLFIVKPTEHTNSMDDMNPSFGLQAIASCSATMEMLQTKDTALLKLREILPMYSSRDLDARVAANSNFDDVCAMIALSRGEIRDAWDKLCAFEDHDTSYRPSADILLSLWKTIMTASIADSLDLTSAFLVDDVWKAVEDEDYPRGLFLSLLKRLEDSSSMQLDDSAQWCSLDQQRCLNFIAALVLECSSAKIKPDDFIAEWKECLPERWREAAYFSKLEIIEQPSSNMIVLRREHRLNLDKATPSVAMVSIPGPPSKSRKWHEKFKKGRS